MQIGQTGPLSPLDIREIAEYLRDRGFTVVAVDTAGRFLVSPITPRSLVAGSPWPRPLPTEPA